VAHEWRPEDRARGVQRTVRRGLCVLVVVLSIAPAASGSDERAGQDGYCGSAFGLAEHLYAQGLFDEAITEYLRYLFLRPGGDCVAEAYRGIALSLRESGSWDRSLAYFDQALRTYSDDGDRWQCELDAIATMIAAGRLSGAEYRILRLRATVRSVDRIRQLEYYTAMLFTLSHRWGEARTAVERLREIDRRQGAVGEARWRSVLALLDEVQGAPRKSPDTARWLSVLLPGAGQIYAGDAWQGVVALAANAGCVGVLTYGVTQGRYLESAILFLYIATRLYSGALYNAEEAAYSWNTRIDSEFALQILALLADPERAGSI